MPTELHEPATAPLGELVEALAGLDPASRLGVRAHPALDALADALVRTRETAIVLVSADELARALESGVAGALDPAGDADGVLDDARAQVEEVGGALELAGELAREVGLALAAAGRLGVPGVVDHLLLDALDDVHALAGDVDDALALNQDLGRALGRALVSDRARSRAPVFARELIFAIARALASETVRGEDLADRLDDARHDFRGADLRAAPLAQLAQRGVRWSAATLWPARAADRVRSVSVELGPGIFEVR